MAQKYGGDMFQGQWRKSHGRCWLALGFCMDMIGGDLSCAMQGWQSVDGCHSVFLSIYLLSWRKGSYQLCFVPAALARAHSICFLLKAAAAMLEL